MIPSPSIGPRTLLNDCNHSATAIFWRSAIPHRRGCRRPLPGRVSPTPAMARAELVFESQLCGQTETRGWIVKVKCIDQYEENACLTFARSYEPRWIGPRRAPTVGAFPAVEGAASCLAGDPPEYEKLWPPLARPACPRRISARTRCRLDAGPW